MARAYTVATAALALDVSTKWLDNTLSHFDVQGVHQTRQGVARKLSIDSLIVLAIAVSIIRRLDTSVSKAIELATQLVTSEGSVLISGEIHVAIDIQQTSRSLLQRLEHAVEIAPLPRRGRPPQKTTGRLD